MRRPVLMEQRPARRKSQFGGAAFEGGPTGAAARDEHSGTEVSLARPSIEYAESAPTRGIVTEQPERRRQPGERSIAARVEHDPAVPDAP